MMYEILAVNVPICCVSRVSEWSFLVNSVVSFPFVLEGISQHFRCVCLLGIKPLIFKSELASFAGYQVWISSKSKGDHRLSFILLAFKCQLLSCICLNS